MTLDEGIKYIEEALKKCHDEMEPGEYSELLYEMEDAIGIAITKEEEDDKETG